MKRRLLACLLCWSAGAFAADPWCGPRHDGVYKLTWVPKDAQQPTTGSIRIDDARTGRTLQVLENLENYYGDRGLYEDHGFDTRDLNNDGCGDLAVVNDVAGIGNQSVTAYLYDRATRRFVHHQGLSDIGGLDVDPKDPNCVTGFWKSGAADFGATRYCWRKGKLRIREAHSTSAVYDQDGNFSCYSHVDTTYRNGRKTTKTTCDAEL